jgi:outer membrane lipoprotein-sorting protein
LKVQNQSRFRSAGRGVRGTIARIAAVIIITSFASDVLAETVPLPRPAPKARDTARPSDITGGASLAGTPPPPFQSTPPNPILPNPRLRPVADGVFDAAQRAQVAKVSTYLSSLSTLVGNFVQVAPNGNRSTGEFYMQKPGKVRFAYDPPSPIDVVSDGKTMVVRDRKLATQDVYPLSQTPLRYLLSDRIDLMRDTNVVNVSADDVFVTVTIEERQALIGTSRLMLMIGTKDNQLKQWTVTDPQGYDTTIAVYNLNTQKKPDPELFRIDYTRYDDGRNN